jgi:hypothetical protein
MTPIVHTKLVIIAETSKRMVHCYVDILSCLGLVHVLIP